MQKEIKQGKSIFNFKKGDIIIRLEPVITKVFISNVLENEVVELPDHSLCDPLELLAVENNLIYLKYVSGNTKNHITTVPLETYVEGWDLFVLPEGLTLEYL